MRYKIWTNGDKFKVQRKRFLGWQWLDATEVWCNWYGKQRPRLFETMEEVEEFIKGQEHWKLSKEIKR